MYGCLKYLSMRIYWSMAAKHDFNMERFFQALGDDTRLRLLNLMGDQEICVCYFVEILKIRIARRCSRAHAVEHGRSTGLRCR